MCACIKENTELSNNVHRRKYKHGNMYVCFKKLPEFDELVKCREGHLLNIHSRV